MFHLNLGSVPEWFGGLALALALITLMRDRQDRRRAQVYLIGAWCDQIRQQADNPRIYETNAHIRNGSHLPLIVVLISVQWGVSYGAVGVDPHSPDVQLRPGTIGPESDWETRVTSPQVSLTALQHGPQVFAHINELEVIDNAGRRWVINPQTARLARQVHPFSRLPAWLVRRT